MNPKKNREKMIEVSIIILCILFSGYHICLYGVDHV